MSQPDKNNSVNSSEQVLHQYQKERYAHFIARTNQLDELAFKTSERYDQWVLSLAGGALAVSITFLEKIAPHPAPWTLWILALSWLSFIVSILAGFYAIHHSREAIYREMEIASENYDTFISTCSTQNMLGETPTKKENEPRFKVENSNKCARGCLAGGTFCLCVFALMNLVVSKNIKIGSSQEDTSVKLYLPASIISCINNTNIGTPMSKETNKPIQGATPPTTDGSIKGIHVGDPTRSAKGSYTPTQQDTPPPPPQQPPAKE